jgi:hypothetical protein
MFVQGHSSYSLTVSTLCRGRYGRAMPCRSTLSFPENMFWFLTFLACGPADLAPSSTATGTAVEEDEIPEELPEDAELDAADEGCTARLTMGTLSFSDDAALVALLRLMGL